MDMETIRSEINRLGEFCVARDRGLRLPVEVTRGSEGFAISAPMEVIDALREIAENAGVTFAGTTKAGTTVSLRTAYDLTMLAERVDGYMTERMQTDKTIHAMAQQLNSIAADKKPSEVLALLGRVIEASSLNDHVQDNLLSTLRSRVSQK